MAKNNCFLSCAFLIVSILIVVFVIGIDHNVRWPFFSFFISIIGCALFICKKRIIGIIFFVATPLCIINGVMSQEIALSHAENMKKELFQSQGILEARKKYHFLCQRKCYSIRFILGDNINSSYLLVFKFFGRRQIIPLDPEKISYESEVID
jgi:hypothetical protein